MNRKTAKIYNKSYKAGQILRFIRRSVLIALSKVSDCTFNLNENIRRLHPGTKVSLYCICVQAVNLWLNLIPKGSQNQSSVCF